MRYGEEILSLRLKQSIRIYFYTAKKSSFDAKYAYYRIRTRMSSGSLSFIRFSYGPSASNGVSPDWGLDETVN